MSRPQPPTAAHRLTRVTLTYYQVEIEAVLEQRSGQSQVMSMTIVGSLPRVTHIALLRLTSPVAVAALR